jgi:NTE family protein
VRQGSSAEPTDIALPRRFDAGYGDGLARGLSLGGGGIFFVAWQIAYLHGLAAEGVDLAGADRVVGTSAGSVVATALVGGRLSWVHRELSILANLPALVSMLAPSSGLKPSQMRALELFVQADNSRPETVRAIGHAALAAATPPAAAMRRSISLVLGKRSWPSPRLHVSCVDTYTGERCIVTDGAKIGAPLAVAASSAVPGLFAPQRIGERYCMDGGVSGSGTHLDVLAGAGRTLVLALTEGSELTEGVMTVSPGDIRAEVDALAATGTDVELRVPEATDPDELMSPGAVPKAIEMGHRQAAADATALNRFWRRRPGDQTALT